MRGDGRDTIDIIKFQEIKTSRDLFLVLLFLLISQTSQLSETSTLSRAVRVAGVA